ncbi:MAG: hypothetical protein HYY52_01575 [Candidatus Melainabacteria bacterium]|nr:hypothetical protein [Candidatus Melainabacteria bacterium]
MVKKATSCMLAVLILSGLFGFNWPTAKAQTASPSQAVISVSGVPGSTQGLAVEVTVDTSIITLGSATSSVSPALVLTGGMSEGVGIISETALPASFTITVPLTGVMAGTSMFAVGNVLDMLGGTAITGAMASADVSSVTVASSSTTSSTTSSSTSSGGAGMLSADTITITINGQAVNDTIAVNVTLNFSTPNVVTVDSGVTFMGTGATQLLTEVMGSVLSAAWDGTITDSKAVLTAMLKPGTALGATMISVSKVEAAGGTDVTSSVVATVSPDSVTNSAASTTAGTFALLGPTSVVGPGKAAVALSVENLAMGATATLNGSKVEFVGNNTAGVAIIDVSMSGTLPLSLVVSGETIALGDITVTAGEGKAPKVTNAVSVNKASGTKLTITGKKFVKNDTTVSIVPTDREASSTKVKSNQIKASYSADECIPNGSYVNVSTGGGTSAKKIKARGACSNSLVE